MNSSSFGGFACWAYFRKNGIYKTEGLVFYTRGTAMSKRVLGDKALHYTSSQFPINKG